MILAFLGDILSKLGWRAGALFVLTGLTTLLEGVAVALLLPLLHQFGIGSAEGARDPVTTAVTGLASQVGIDLTISTLAVAIGLVVVVQVSVFLLAQYWSGKCQAAYISAWLRAQFAGLIGAKWSLFHRYSMAQAVNNLTGDILHKVANAFIHLMVLVAAAFFVAVYGALAFAISWQLALFLVAAAIVLLVLMRPLARYANQVGRRLVETDEALTVLISQYVSGIKVMKVFGLQGVALRDFAAMAKIRENSYFHYIFDPGFSRAVVEFFGPLVLLAALVYGVNEFTEDPAAVLVVLALFARLYPRLSTMQQALHSLRILSPAFESTRALRDMSEAYREDEHTGAHRAFDGKPIELEYRKVCAGFGENAVLINASAKIPAGAFVVVTGPSGAGKTTLIDATLGLIELKDGSILAGGEALEDIATHVWRGLVGYVDQDSLLFHDSVANNIRAGDADLDSEAIEAAAKTACAHEFIETMDGGYSRIVGEGGKGLSGGQRQRIAIARALARKPGLLLLDEATSALDQEIEARLLKNLNKLKSETTILLMTHRDQPKKAADIVFELRDGQLRKMQS